MHVTDVVSGKRDGAFWRRELNGQEGGDSHTYVPMSIKNMARFLTQICIGYTVKSDVIPRSHRVRVSSTRGSVRGEVGRKNIRRFVFKCTSCRGICLASPDASPAVSKQQYVSGRVVICANHDLVRLTG